MSASETLKKYILVDEDGWLRTNPSRWDNGDVIIGRLSGDEAIEVSLFLRGVQESRIKSLEGQVDMLTRQRNAAYKRLDKLDPSDYRIPPGGISL